MGSCYRRATVISSLVLWFFALTADAQQQDSAARRITADSVKADTVLLAKIRALEAGSSRLTEALAQAEARRKATLDNLAKTARSTDTLLLRVAALEQQRALDQAAEAAAIKFRVGVTRTILGEMNKGVVFITFTQNAIDLEQTDMLLKNLWSSQDLRNAWDRVDTWGTFLGGAAALTGLTQKGDTRINIVGAGAGAIGLARLLGSSFGKNRADKINEVAQRIALSRRAYDALNIRNGELREYVLSNRSFRSRVQRFQDSIDLAKTRGDSVLLVALVGPLLDEYAQITSQIPSYIDAIIITNKQHAKSFAALDTVLAPITKKAEDLQGQYKTEVLPVLQYANRLRALLDPDVVRYLDERARDEKAKER